jgi:NAD(P)H-dependent flavin oxidoreductase YrpB (nitropropane dioxygenase family)
MNWRTRVTDLLGSRYPIIQGAFGGFGISALAAPVSEAGGFGIITASALRTPEGLREDIRKARSMTDQPFGVNISVGLCPRIDEMREVAIEERVPVVFTAAYRADDHGQRVKEAGLKWVHKVATIQHALAAERHGADAVVIVGLEGAGFKNISQVPTLVTITTAARMLKIPVIAAGGIGDARSFLASLAMGAEGVYIGTAFIATKECPISDRYKEALVKSQPWEPEIHDRALAPPKRKEYERVAKEKGTMSMDEWLPRMERVHLKQTPEFKIDWDADYDPGEALRITGPSLAVGLIDRVVSVKALIDTIIQEAEQMLSPEGHLGRFLNK